MFEVLERAGLISRGKLNGSAIASLPFSRLIDVADTVSTSFNSPEAHRGASHSASLALGGGPAECENRRCRLRKIGTLARFAGLYSDGVVVDNFFADYASVSGHPPEHDSDGLRRRIADDIAVVLSVRPLIEAGLITFFSPAVLQGSDHICIDCLAQMIFGAPGHRRFRKALDQLSERYLASLSVEAYYEDGCYHLDCSLPEDLWEHGGVVFHGEPADELTGLPRILSRIDNGERVHLSKASCQRIGIHKRLAGFPMANILYHASVSNALGTSLLTSNSLDINLLHSIGTDPVTQRRNEILQRHFELMLPFADDVPVKQLLKLRQREEEAFLRFQAAMNRMVTEIRAQRGEMTVQDARSLYGDTIRPRLAELDQKLKEAKRDLVRRPAASFAGVAAVLGVGFFSGVVAAELGAIIGAMGGLKAVYDVTAKAVELSDVEKAIRQDDMYFLWRARNLART